MDNLDSVLQQIRALLNQHKAAAKAELAGTENLLSAMERDTADAPTEPPNGAPRRRMSPQARKRMSLRMKAYWAKRRKGTRA